MKYCNTLLKNISLLSIFTVTFCYLHAMSDDTKQVIDLEFSNGTKATYSDSGLSFKGPVSIVGNFSMTPSSIQYGGVSIDRSLTLAEIVRQLQANPNMKSATLNVIPLSPDEKFTKEVVVVFNQAQAREMPLAEKIALTRDFYARAQQYSADGSTRARENVPLLQSVLGIDLANLANDQEDQESLTSLREAVDLLAKSSSAGVQNAIRNLPTVNLSLGIALLNSASQDDIEQSTPLLREAISCLETGKKMGNDECVEVLSIAQCRLGMNLYAACLAPHKMDIEAGKVISLNDTEITSLKEVRYIISSSVKSHRPEGVEKILNHVNGIIDSSAPARPERPQRTVQEGQQQLALQVLPTRREVMPAWFAHTQNESNPDLICANLLSSSYNPNKELVRKLAKDKKFMEEKGLGFFEQLAGKMNLMQCDMLIHTLIEEGSSIDDIVTLACGIIKNHDDLFFLDGVISPIVKMPDYKPEIHGVRITNVLPESQEFHTRSTRKKLLGLAEQ